MPFAQRQKLQLTVETSLATLLGSMEAVRPAFTVPGFRNAWVVFAGWVMTAGVHAVTQALVLRCGPNERAEPPSLQRR
jgi:hypothetical protein